MICYILYFSIHICISPRNGHYHACKFILHLMLLLNQNTTEFHNLVIYFYLVMTPIDKINFFNRFFFSYPQSSHMILKDKTKLTHWFRHLFQFL